jgi:integrase
VWRESGPGGKSRQRNKSFAKAADAKAFAAKMAAEVERRGVGDAGRHSTGQYLARWHATMRDRGEHSPTTLESYEHCIASAKPWIGDIPLDKLSAADLDRAYGQMLKEGGRGRNKQARPLAARTVVGIHRCLHAAFEQARKWKMIAENPARDARAPSIPRPQVRALAGNEVTRALDVAAAEGPVAYAMTATFLTCGLRRSELIGLAFDAIDFEAGTLEVKRVGVEVAHRAIIRDQPKTTSRARTIKIPPALVALLRAQLGRVREQMLQWGKEYQREPLYVFPGLAGVPMPPQNVTGLMRKVLRGAGIKGIQPCHGWRHTAATTLLNNGTNIKTVQARLGHSTPAITLSLYVHPVDERDAEAAEQLGKLIEREG